MQKSPHLSFEELQKMINEIEKQIPIGSTREHYKTTGKYYEIMDLIIDEATDSVSVLYHPIKSKIIFSRLASIFLEKVKDKDGNKIGRFKMIGSNEKKIEYKKRKSCP